MTEKRNLILISIDSLRADHCGFLGYERGNTPFLSDPPCNKLTFSNAISPSSWTLPAMKSIFTSDQFFDFHPDMLGKYRQSKMEFQQQSTIAEEIKEFGYKTAGFSPNPHTATESGFESGFDYFEDFEGYGFKPEFMKGRGAIETLYDFVFENSGFTTFEAQIEAIDNQINSSAEPWFMWSFLLDTHIPYQSPFNKYSNQIDKLLKNLYYWNKTGGDDYGRVEFNVKNKKTIIDLYDDSILAADEFISRIWSRYKSKNPVIVIFGDHGEAFGEHGYYVHARELHEELTHVPLLILNSEIDDEITKPYSLLDLKELIRSIVMGQEQDYVSKLKNRDGVAHSQVFDNGEQKIAIRDGPIKYHFSNDGVTAYNLETSNTESLHNQMETRVPERIKDRHRHLRHECEKAIVDYVLDQIELK